MKNHFFLGGSWNLAQSQGRINVDRKIVDKVFRECCKESVEYFDSTSCRVIYVLCMLLLHMWKVGGFRTVVCKVINQTLRFVLRNNEK